LPQIAGNGIKAVSTWENVRNGSLSLGQKGWQGHDLGRFCSVRDYQRRSTTASGKLVFHVMGALAEFEHALISERPRVGDARRQKAWKHLGQSVSN
jgi:hypothetical protein